VILDFITYLQGELSQDVKYAYTSDPVEDVDEDLPIIFVYPGSFSASPSETDNYVRQLISEEVICLIGCPIADYESIRDQLRAAAIGWTHEEYDALELSGGETLNIAGGVIWVQETYMTRRIIRQV